MSSAAADTVALVKRWLKDSFPDALVMPFQMADMVDGFDGFSVASGFGSLLLFIDSTERQDWRWTLNIYGGLAIDCPDVLDCLLWVNEKNRSTEVGKFYIAVRKDDNTSSVVCSYSIEGIHLEAALVHGVGTAGHLRSLVEGAVRWVEEDSEFCLRSLGGRQFPASQHGVDLLFVTAGYE